MRNMIAKSVQMAFCVLMLSWGTGCKSTAPGSDPVLVRAQQVRSAAFETFDAFLLYEKNHRQELWSQSTTIKHVADKIRVDGYVGLNGLSAAMDTYREDRSDLQKGNLNAAVSFIVKLTSEAAKAYTDSQTIVKKATNAQ